MKSSIRNLALAFSMVAALAVAAADPAAAGGKKGTIGAGAEYQLSGLGGVSVNYDAGTFHLGGFLGFDDGGGDDDTDMTIGGRFYYHVHSTAMSDFGVGGGLGIATIGDRDKRIDDNTTEAFIEPAAQIRAFIASNVALSITGGLSIGLADAEGVEITGHPMGAAGVHYYFF